MDSNKSIDGLTTRRAKKPASVSSNAVNLTKSTSNTAKKSAKKPTQTTTKKPAKKPTQTTTKRPVRRTVKKTTKPVKKTVHTTARPASTTTQPITTTTQPASTTIQPISTTIRPAQSIIKPTPTKKPVVEDSTIDNPIIENPITESPIIEPTPTQTTKDFLEPTQVFNFDENTGELQASNNPEAVTSKIKGKHKEKKAKKPVSKKRKIITSIILAIVILLIAAVTWLIIWGNDIIAKITGGQGNVFDLLTFTEPTYERLKTDDNGRTNILAFGTSGYNMAGDEGQGTHDGAQLTDSIMAISFNQDTGDIAMLSLPRDLKASPTCTATGKINEVYWCSNMDGEHEQEGAEALMDEVSSILGIDFQYYAHLNWGSLVQIVDILGGITVTLDEDIGDYYYTGAVFEAGTPYEINGEQALGLARARHGTTSGDFSRGASQQKIIIGIKDKIQAKSLSLTDLIGLASTLGDNLRTNFNVEELKSVAHLASEFDFESMRQISLIDPEPLMTTGTINGISYVLPSGGVGYYTKIQNYIAKMLSNNPSVYEDATILILNGTETPGLASSEQKTLEDEGYEGIDIDDAPAGTYEDKYTLYALTDEKPGTKKALETKYDLTSKTPEELPAGVNQNYDFILILGGSSSESE